MAAQTPLILIGVLLIMIIIGAIIIFIAGVLIMFLPALIFAGVVYWLTGSETYTGIAFLIIALLSLTRRRR